MAVMMVGNGQPDNEAFGQLMKKIRMEQGLSRKQVTEELEISGDYIRLIEMGLRTPSEEVMDDLMTVYGLTGYTDGEHREKFHFDSPREKEPIVIIFMNRVHRKKSETVKLAGGGEVPVYLVEALEVFEMKWPGATLPRARPAIVQAILEALKKGPQ